MDYEPGEIKTFNPQKGISTEIILEVLTRHRDAFKQARTGELPGLTVEKITDNDRKMNQARALNLIISAQREMITISRPNIIHTSTKKYEKKYKDDKEKEEHKFEDEDNDYNNLIKWLDFLRYCESVILKAERSKALEDDFMVTKQNSMGDSVNELTENFYDMLNDLESSYEQIYLLMLINKIVSAGIEDDDELTYKQKEEEAIKRVVEA
jgi:hypothetical protein